MICPKCRFEQPEGLECVRCGVIFSRYRAPAAAVAPPASAATVLARTASPGSAGTPWPFSPPGAAAPPMASAPGALWEDPLSPAAWPFAPPGPAKPALPPELALAPPPAPPSGTLYDGSAGTVYDASAGTLDAGVVGMAGAAGGVGGVAPGVVPGGAGGRALPAPAAGAWAGGFQGSFAVGTILSEVFATYFGNVLAFVLVAGIALLPMLMLTFAIPHAHGVPTALVLTAGVLLAALIGGQVATGALTFGVLQEMRGRETSVAECFQQALSLLLPIIGVAFLAGMATAVGLVFCFVPGVILAVMFAVAVPVAVEERPGVVDALRRSADLTTGFRWPVLGVLLVLGTLQTGIGLLLNFLPALIPAARPIALLLSGGFQVVGTGISATAAAVMYYRLRSVKEGIDVRDIVSVFD